MIPMPLVTRLRVRTPTYSLHEQCAAAMETHKAAIEAESRAVESARTPFVGARLLPFSFKPDVLARLERPLSEWRAGEAFDVSGVRVAVGADQWHDQLYLRAEGLALLQQWENDAPFLAVHGTPGIGKSTLLQLAALRALVLGEPVLLFVGVSIHWSIW